MHSRYCRLMGALVMGAGMVTQVHAASPAPVVMPVPNQAIQSQHVTETVVVPEILRKQAEAREAREAREAGAAHKSEAAAAPSGDRKTPRVR